MSNGKLPVLTATHFNEGVWDFECPIHDEPFRQRQISSPRAAREMLIMHMDSDHPGLSARIKITSAFSGTKVISHTAPSNIEPGNRL
jgi:hypothetical protein